MFHYFEKLLNPYPDTTPVTPPKNFYKFSPKAVLEITNEVICKDLQENIEEMLVRGDEIGHRCALMAPAVSWPSSPLGRTIRTTNNSEKMITGARPEGR